MSSEIKNMDEQQSPLPWRVKKLPKDPDRDWDAYSVLSKNGKEVLGGEQYGNWAGTLADKKLIVTAVNAHNALVEALNISRNYVFEAIDDWGVEDVNQRRMKADLAKIDSALELAYIKAN